MAITITSSVGRNAVNQPADVGKIQELLNENIHLLIPFDVLNVNGQVDELLISRIETFQRRVQPRTVPDGRVDPGGATLDTLNKNADTAKQKGLTGKPRLPLFPFLRHPIHDPTTGGRHFGANRAGGQRKHAGVDLKMEPGTPIRAMADGKVLFAPADFYGGTKAFAVDHGGFIARYGEISRTAPGFDRVGAPVQRGEIIAYVGRLNSGNSMLHLEIYSGAESGPLTVRSLMPFQRRADLLNPMEFIRNATLNDEPGQDDRNARVGSRVVTVLNVRKEPKASADIVAKLPPGSWLEVIEQIPGGSYRIDGGENDLWFKVDIDGVRGFAAASFVERVSTGLRVPPLPPIDALDSISAYSRVSTRVESILNLRQTADHHSASSARLEPGTLLEIKQKLDGARYSANGNLRADWLQVEVKAGPHQGKTGFVATFYVDPVPRTGQTSAAVTSGLVMREQPELEAARVASLAPGTRFAVVRATTGGTYQDAAGANRTDWFDIEYDSRRGFVAAAFVDLLDPTAPADPNAILFTYEPTGASERTARQDNLPARGILGVKASEAMAETDRARIGAHKGKFSEAGKLFDLPPALLAAIASRETRCGNVLDANGWGDHENAYGIMQVDKRFHSPIETEGGPAGEAHIQQATAILRDKLNTVERRFEGLSDSQSLQAAVSRYNGGSGRLPPHSDEGTTGGDYMNDVWTRARYFAKVEKW